VPLSHQEEASDSISVVYLIKCDPCGHDNVFHPGSMLNRNVRIGVERLDKTRWHRPAKPERTKVRASSTLSNPASIATPRESSNSQSRVTLEDVRSFFRTLRS
jgi:hypothetical protein